MDKNQMFEDKDKKLYFKAFGSRTLMQVKKERTPYLFDYIIVNYEKIAKEYVENNKDKKIFANPVDWYVSDKHFQEIKKELRYKSPLNNNHIVIGFASNQTLCYLKHESMRPKKSE